MIMPKSVKQYLLHTEGMGLREISRKLNVGCNSVSRIIDQQGEMPKIKRKDIIDIDPELLRSQAYYFIL